MACLSNFVEVLWSTHRSLGWFKPFHFHLLLKSYPGIWSSHLEGLTRSPFWFILQFHHRFCFLQSIRHSLSLIFELDNNFNKGLNKFVKKAIPLTVLTAIIYLLSLFYLNKYYPADQAIYKVIFIGLASLTFPHILLEYLIEKNEK